MHNNTNTFKLPEGLFVSCQAREGNPFRDSVLLSYMAQAAVMGGAVGIRADGVEDIREIRKKVDVPIIGINKKYDSSGRIVITPDYESAAQIAAVGVDIIALDATFQESDIRPDVAKTIDEIKTKLHLPVMADISTLQEAERAVEMGADIVATTLSGYLPGAPYPHEEKYIPNLDLLKKIIDSPKINVPVIGEGRFWNPEDVAEAFKMGAGAIVIGKAITNPMAATEYFVSHIRK